MAYALVQNVQLYASAVPAGQGAMAAILNLDDAIIEEVCRSISPEGLVGANYNSPGQLVIAGKKLVEQAMAACKESGAKRFCIAGIRPIPFCFDAPCC